MEKLHCYAITYNYFTSLKSLYVFIDSHRPTRWHSRLLQMPAAFLTPDVKTLNYTILWLIPYLCII